MLFFTVLYQLKFMSIVHGFQMRSIIKNVRLFFSCTTKSPGLLVLHFQESGANSQKYCKYNCVFNYAAFQNQAQIGCFSLWLQESHSLLLYSMKNISFVLKGYCHGLFIGSIFAVLTQDTLLLFPTFIGEI